MCVQYKQRYELCPHVAYDYNVMECKRAARGMLCKFKIARIPEVIWTGTRHEGKSCFCELEEQDEQEAKKRKRRMARNLDLFEDAHVMDDSDKIVSSQKSDSSKETNINDEKDVTDGSLHSDKSCAIT